MKQTTLASITTASLLLLIGAGCSPALSPEEQNTTSQDDAMMEDHMDDGKGDTMSDDTMMKDDSSADAQNTQDAMEDESMMKDGDTMMEDDNTAMNDEDHMMTAKGSYEAYSPEKIALASADHDVVLFFHASWCPTCKAVNDDINAHLSNIPDSLTLLKTDYDTETALKKKYGVTYQHTFVQVDAKGNLIKKWSGSPTLASLVAEVQ